MGLAGPKKRTKIGSDPNNTAWTSSTTTFGHKILTSQGWTPGTYLGAADASHSDFYTAANASHIRVLLKDDNLGLGAARARAEGKEFGLLGGFQDLLGRLNGKSEEKREKEAVARADLGRKMYAEMKWGPARFVKGGFLVGDKIEEVVPVVQKEELFPRGQNEGTPSLGPNSRDGLDEQENLQRSSASMEKERPRKRKRKDIPQGTTAQSSVSTIHTQQTLKPSSSSLSITQSSTPTPQIGNETKTQRRQRKLEARARKAAKRIVDLVPFPSSTPANRSLETSQAETPNDILTEAEPESNTLEATDSEKTVRQQRRIDKFVRKEARHQRRQAKLEGLQHDGGENVQSIKPETLPVETARPISTRSSSVPFIPANESHAGQSGKVGPTIVEVPDRVQSTTSSGTSTPLNGGLAVRQRYLRQKRMACMDPQAMREILMLKS